VIVDAEQRIVFMRKVIILSAFVIFSAFLVQNSFAIGVWHEGIVTKAPWHGQYTFIQIDNVRYTIMKGAKVVRVYEKKGATYKKIMNVYFLLEGQTLTFKKEGNRIYQIEKTR